MSLGTAEPASETGDDGLSAITFDSDFETKAKRKSFHKPPPTSPKSPYYSKPRKVASWRSLRTVASMPLGNRMSLTPQKLWLGSSNQGHVPGTLVYREKEDMYDEIIELKKSLHMQKSDVDLMRTKLRRLEEENSRKDRQIEQLLDPSRGPDFVRTLAEKRPDAGWVVNGLKQRILKLEQQCKEKDNVINKLQTDMKTTNLEEMRIAVETYYEEIHRLQTLLASSETAGKRTPGEKKMGLKRQKKVSSALLSLSRSVQELTEENQSLKEDLDRVLSNSPTVSTMKGYVEWSKPRLLRRIAELEKKISSMESPKLHASEVVKSNAVVRSASSSTVPRQPGGDRQDDSERLRGAVQSLKGERNALQMQLQEKELEVKQLLQTNADLQQELEHVKGGEEERRGTEEALREEIQTLTKKCQELEEIRRQERDDPVERSLETPEEPRPSLPTSRPSQQDCEPDPSKEGSRPPSACSEGRRDTAARILQTRWKVYRRQKKKAVLTEAATVLQAAFRGHLTRVKLLPSQACASEAPGSPSPPGQDPPPRLPSPAVQAEDDPGQEAITTVQSVLRAHLARVRHSASGQRTTTAASRRRRPTLATPCQSPAVPCPASPGQEGSDTSSGETVDGLAAKDKAPGLWGPGKPAALQPGSASRSLQTVNFGICSINSMYRVQGANGWLLPQDRTLSHSPRSLRLRMTAARTTRMRLSLLWHCPRGRRPRRRPWALPQCRLCRGAQARSRGHSDQNQKVVYLVRKELPTPQLSALVGFSLWFGFAACLAVRVGILKPLLHLCTGFQGQLDRRMCPGWGQPRALQTHAPGSSFLATVGLEPGRAALSGATQQHLVLPTNISGTVCSDLHPVSRSSWTRWGRAFRKRGT
ncbi:IQ domain-containing protein E isoform X3 [Zalophus californianus]|uniref:IQ domain-containing protein E isoform X3 n=1 Tax=Zalophus californianus TaxID=9704 RepID=A0A6P9FCE0_ZALCA|nr:IQ domain-containing protein E isoform X3 [Zalophus californianus]